MKYFDRLVSIFRRKKKWPTPAYGGEYPLGCEDVDESWEDMPAPPKTPPHPNPEEPDDGFGL